MGFEGRGDRRNLLVKDGAALGKTRDQTSDLLSGSTRLVGQTCPHETRMRPATVPGHTGVLGVHPSWEPVSSLDMGHGRAVETGTQLSCEDTKLRPQSVPPDTHMTCAWLPARPPTLLPITRHYPPTTPAHD